MKTYDIAVVHGDGIGPEVCQSAIDVLVAAFGKSLPLRFTEYPAGAGTYLKTGNAVPEETFEGCRRAGRDPPRRRGPAGRHLCRRHRARQ
ncbi:MAG: isocitrate/isopropylmalate family dehydrogenase [Acetobacteraceae bacterium]